SLDLVSPPSIVRPGLPETMEDALLKALSKVPADRYATTTLFAEALAVPGRPSGLRGRPTGAAGPARPRSWMRPAGAVAGGVVLISLAWAGLAAIRGGSGGARSRSAGDVDPSRVAVLYFSHRGDSARTTYLADGLTEALIHELSAVKALQVISANGVRPYRNETVRPDSLRRALGVGSIVEGTVTQDSRPIPLHISPIQAATRPDTR